MTRTIDLLKIPRYISPKLSRAKGSGSTVRRPDGIVQDAGIIALLPHMFLSSSLHFREARPEGSRRSRAYAGLIGGERKRHGSVPRQDSQQAPSSRYLQDSVHKARTSDCEGCCRAGRENRMQTCRGDRALAGPGELSLPLSGVRYYVFAHHEEGG